LRLSAISLRPFQKASSRLTLVLCPSIATDRLTTKDFIIGPPKLPTPLWIISRFGMKAGVVDYRRRARRIFVMNNTATSVVNMEPSAPTKGDVMNNNEQDIAALIELLNMAAERWPRSEADQVCQSELFREEYALLEMWPEACRRTGVGKREFPPGVIKLWKEGLGGAN
jgi:hypothetical protein